MAKIKGRYPLIRTEKDEKTARIYSTLQQCSRCYIQGNGYYVVSGGLWLADKGIRVSIAHPERNHSVFNDIEKLVPLFKMGCLFQITGGSLTGVFKDASRDCAVELLKRGWVSIIATDAHNTHARCPELEPARQVAANIIGEEESIEMVLGHPEKISNMHFQS